MDEKLQGSALRRLHATLGCLLGLMCCSVLPAFGQTADLDIQPAFVPAQRPDLWPKGDWRPVRPEDYRRLIDDQRPRSVGPMTSRLMIAEYSAVLAGNDLRNGKLRADVIRLQPEPGFLSLEPMNLALSRLYWDDDQPATWGTTPANDTVLKLDGDSQHIHGEWNLQGRVLPRSTEFEFELPAATVTRISLQIPADRELVASAGTVRADDTVDANGLRNWQIDLGSLHTCHVSIVRKAASQERAPVILYDQNTSFIVGQAGLQYRANFSVEVFGAPVEELTFLLPVGTEVRSVIYGEDTVVNWSLVAAESRNTRALRVRLPQAVVGLSRTVQISGIGSARYDRPMSLPQLTLKQGIFTTGGTTTLQVESPTVLRNVDMTGYRQANPLAMSALGQTITFHRYLADAELVVEIGYPQLTQSSRVFEHIAADSRVWKLTADIEWRARSGSSFQARCKVPREWEITDVRATAASATSGLASWHVQIKVDGSRELVLEFFEALSTDNSRNVRVEARRIPPAADETASLSVVETLNCDDSETVIAVSHPSTEAFLLETGGDFEQIARETLAPFWRSAPLWNDLDLPDNHRLALLHSDISQATGQFRLRNTIHPIDVSALVELDLQPNRLIETFEIECSTATDSVDRLLVYLTVPGTALTWTTDMQDSGPLSARRIPVERHREWALPESGELWEVRLPSLPPDSFIIRAARESVPSDRNVATLAYVPETRGFHGSLALRTAPGVNVDVTTQGLRRATPEPAADEDDDTFDQDVDLRGGIWLYESLAASLEFESLNIRSTGAGPLLVAVEMETLLASSGSGRDRHRVLMSLNENPATDFRFRLPSPAEITRVLVNGQEIVVSVNEGEYSVPSPIRSHRWEIEIEYETPAADGFLTADRSFLTPHFVYAVSIFRWSVVAAPQLRLLPGDGPVRFDALTPAQTWTNRLFGPIGRAPGTQALNPFSSASWRSVFAKSSSNVPQRTALAMPSVVPAGWQTWSGVAFQVPAMLELSVYHQTRAEALEWLCLITCVAAGLVLRILELPARYLCAAIWLTICLVCVFLAPPLVAETMGACFSGTLLAMLLPRRLLTVLRMEQPRGEGISLGSTRTIRSVPLIVLCGMIAFATAVVGAQERTVSPMPASAKPTSAPASVDPSGFNVLVPVDEAGKPTARLDVVYLTDQLWRKLNESRRVSVPTPDYLISSARYSGSVDEQDLITMRAAYEIDVLTDAPSIRCRLPLGTANFSGPDACTVDGIRTPLRNTEDGTGIEIELSRPLPPTTIEPAADGPRSTQVQPVRVHVELVFHPAVTSASGGGLFSLNIPAIADSELNLNFRRDLPAISVPSGRGIASVNPDPANGGGTTLVARLGKTDQLEVRWWSKEREETSAETEAQVYTLVEIHPTRLQYHCHVTYVVRKGAIDYLKWQLPSGMLLRSVAVADQPVTTSLTSAGDSTELAIQFPDPQSGVFKVDATLLLPIQSTEDKVSLPNLDPFGPQSYPPNAKVTERQLGVFATREYQLDALVEGGEAATQISVETFVKNWGAGSSDNAKRTEKAYQIPRIGMGDGAERLTFSLRPLVPLRLVREDQIGQVTRNRLLWTVSAEITTANAPAFQHVLLCNPRLRIESISVMEDDVERLVHWARIGRRLVLFLGHKTSGIQTLTLKGSLPINRTGDTDLPVVHFEDAQMMDSQILLYQDQSVDVQIDAQEFLVPMELNDSDSADSTNDVFVGRFEYLPNAPAPHITARIRQGIVRPRSVTILEHQDADSWKLSHIYRFQNDSDSVSQIPMNVPPELAGRFEVLVDDADTHEDVQPDGSILVTLTPNRDDWKELEVRIVAVVQQPTEGEWSIPALTLPQIRVADQYLVIFPADTLAPANTTAVKFTPATVPEGVIDDAQLARMDDDFDVYAGDGSHWRLNRRQPAFQASEASLPLIVHRVWETSSAGCEGETQIYTVMPPGRDLHVPLPAGMRLKNVLLDGHPFQGQQRARGGLTVPANWSSGAHVISLFWFQPPSRSLSGIHTMQPTFPEPTDLPVHHRVIRLAADPSSMTLVRTSLEQTSPAAAVAEALRGMLDFNRISLVSQGAVHQESWQSIENGSATLLGMLQAGNEASTAEDAQTRRALVAIQQELAALRGELAKNPPQLQIDNLSDQVYQKSDWQRWLQDSSDRTFQPTGVGTPTAPVMIWVFPRRNIAIAVGLGILLVVAPLLTWLFKSAAAQWLTASEPASWLLIGILWWQFCIPSSLGFFVVIVAIASLARWGWRSWQTSPLIPSSSHFQNQPLGQDMSDN